jgi:hypothetical protein
MSGTLYIELIIYVSIKGNAHLVPCFDLSRCHNLHTLLINMTVLVKGLRTLVVPENLIVVEPGRITTSATGICH